MPRGDLSGYSDEQKAKIQKLTDSYQQHGKTIDEARAIAVATVNKQDGGGKRSGSGRARSAANDANPNTRGGKGRNAAEAAAEPLPKAAKGRAENTRRESTAGKSAKRDPDGTHVPGRKRADEARGTGGLTTGLGEGRQAGDSSLTARKNRGAGRATAVGITMAGRPNDFHEPNGRGRARSSSLNRSQDTMLDGDPLRNVPPTRKGNPTVDRRAASRSSGAGGARKSGQTGSHR